MNNIDAIGTAFATAAMHHDPDANTEDDDEAVDKLTSKNVGDLNLGNAELVGFNYLSGHQTSALKSTSTGGSDQTAAWGVNALTRPAVTGAVNAITMVAAYTTLTPTAADDSMRLAEQVHGGVAVADTSRAEITGRLLGRKGCRKRTAAR